MSQMNEFVGEVPVRIDGCVPGSDSIRFTMKSGKVIQMFHYRECCENVSVEEVIGCDPQDLIGEEILFAETTSNSENSIYGDVAQWTFYKIGSHGGFMTIHWFGSSNGYYGTSVDIEVTNSTDN